MGTCMPQRVNKLSAESAGAGSASSERSSWSAWWNADRLPRSKSARAASWRRSNAQSRTGSSSGPACWRLSSAAWRPRTPVFSIIPRNGLVRLSLAGPLGLVGLACRQGAEHRLQHRGIWRGQPSRAASPRSGRRAGRCRRAVPCTRLPPAPSHATKRETWIIASPPMAVQNLPMAFP